MKYLGSLGIYIATQSKRDPIDAGWEIAKELGLDWRDTDDLLNVIFLAKRYGVDKGLKEKALKIIHKDEGLKEKALKIILDEHKRTEEKLT